MAPTRPGPPPHHRRVGGAGRSRSESIVHAVPSLAISRGSCARHPWNQPARVQPAESADLPVGHVAVHGRLSRRRDGSPVRARRIDLALQHRQRRQARSSTESGPTIVTSARPGTVCGRTTRRRIPRTSLGRRRAASIPAKLSRRACLDRPGCATRTSTPRGSRAASSSALWATRARSARRCNGAFRSSRRTTARRYAPIG